MISEIFPAASDEAARQCLVHGPAAAGIEETVPAGELTEAELDALQSLLTGEPFVKVLESPGGGMVAGRDAGPWIGRIRPALVRALVGLDDADVSRTANLWAQREELAEHDPELLAAVLPPLTALARTVEESGPALYIWNRL